MTFYKIFISIKKIIEYFAIRFCRFLCQISPRNTVCVLTFHRVLDENNKLSVFDRTSSAQFKSCIEFISKIFDIVDLEKSLKDIEENKQIKPSVAITFDDGYAECATVVLDVLKEFNVKATFFLTTAGIIEGVTWESKIEQNIQYLIENNKYSLYFCGKYYDFKDLNEAVKNVKEITSILKYKKISERNLEIKQLENLTGIKNYNREFINIEQVKLLCEEGMGIGSHTVNHPILSFENSEIVEGEVLNSIKVLEEITGKKIQLFAYPNGKKNIDFDFNTQNIIKNIGIKYAFSTEWGCVNSTSEHMFLKRATPWYSNKFLFALKICLILIRSK